MLYTTAAHAHARRLESRDLELRTLHSRGTVAWARGDLEAAVGLLTECSNLAKVRGSTHCELAAVLCLAETYIDLRQFDLAADLAGEALSMARTLGERRQEVGGLEVLATALFGGGRGEAAETLFREALTKARELSFGYGEVSIQLGLAALCRADGRVDEASAMCKSAVDAMNIAGRVLLESRAYTELGLTLAAAGNHAAAQESLARAVSLAEARGQRLASERAREALEEVRVGWGVPA